MCSLFQTMVGPDGLLKIADGVGALPPGAIKKGNGCYVTNLDQLITENGGFAATFNGGVGFTFSGRCCVAIAGVIAQVAPNAMPLDGFSRVVIAPVATIDAYIAGVGISLAAGGAIAGLPPA